MKTEQKQNAVKSIFQFDWRKKYVAGEPLRIGNNVQFLFDDYLVEDCYGLRRVVGPVEKYPGNPLDTGPAMPWESYGCCLQDVIYDSQEKLYKGWYGFMKDRASQVGIETGCNYSTCYAESLDGLVWQKPRLDIFPWGDHQKTNIVLTRENGTASFKGGVYLDPRANDPNQRFMALAKMVPPGEKIRCIVRMVSPDGRKWSLPADPVLFRGASDGSYSLIYNQLLECWMLYRRPPTNWKSPWSEATDDFYKGYSPKRHVSVCQSKDMKTWTHPRTVVIPDEVDAEQANGTDIDDVKVYSYRNIFVGGIGVMDNYQSLGKNNHLMLSRDGMNWQRLPDRPRFIENGNAGEWDGGEIQFTTLIPRGDRIYMYYIGRNVPTRTTGGLSAHIVHEKCDGTGNRRVNLKLKDVRSTGLAFIGKDRWVGQQAGPEGGYLLTRQFILEGNQLVINCRSQVERPPSPELGGLIRAELLQQPVEHCPAATYPGYSMKDCDPVKVTDNPDQPLTWNGASDLSPLRGKPVYVRFYLRNATLYTLQVADQAYI